MTKFFETYLWWCKGSEEAKEEDGVDGLVDVGRKRSKRHGGIQHFMNNARKKCFSAQAEYGGRFFVFYVSLLRSIRCWPGL